MKHIKTFLHYFISITTLVTAVIGIDAATSDIEGLSKYTLLYILEASAATALVTTLVFSYTPKNRKQNLIQTAIHFVLLCVTIVIMGLCIGWIAADIKSIAITCLYVFIIYVVEYFISSLMLKREADEFNRAINERRKNRTGGN